jgi:hypothetical protein
VVRPWGVSFVFVRKGSFACLAGGGNGMGVAECGPRRGGGGGVRGRRKQREPAGGWLSLFWWGVLGILGVRVGVEKFVMSAGIGLWLPLKGKWGQRGTPRLRLRRSLGYFAMRGLDSLMAGAQRSAKALRAWER